MLGTQTMELQGFYITGQGGDSSGEGPEYEFLINFPLILCILCLTPNI